MSLKELISNSEDLPTWPAMRSLAYRMPKGFSPWRTIGGIGAAMIAAKGADIDAGTRLNISAWEYWASAQLPLYCISNNLLRDFEQTDVDGLEKLIPDDWEPPLPGFILALPENSVRSPAGNPVPYLMVLLHHPSFNIPMRTAYPRQVSTLFIDWSCTTWITGIGIKSGERKLCYEEAFTDEPEISRWLASIQAIALQSVFSLEHLQDLVSGDSPSQSQPHRKAKAKPTAQPQERSPRWLGKDYQRSGTSRSNSGHSAPATHWRRGHWRQQPHGEGRRSRRLVWVRPTLVNAG